MRARALAAAVAPALALAGAFAGACKREQAHRAKAVAAQVSPQAWAEVEAAGAPALAPGPADDLVRALDLIDQDKPDLRDVGRDPAHDDQLAEQLPPSAVDAVAALVRWDQVHGRLPPGRACVGSGGPLHALHLARAALLVAGGDADAPSVRAAISLAARYRAEGISLLEAMTGGGIADEVRHWSAARSLPASASARLYQPTDDDLVRVAAAEALCTLDLFQRLRRPEGRDDAESLARMFHATTEAERAQVIAAQEDEVRGYWLAVLADLRGRAADPAGTDRRLADRDDELHRHPEQHPVLAVMVPMTRVLGQLRASDAVWRAFLSGQPAAEP
ncbi:MAG TPA: hypothetical protein VHE35_14695 [Kofleriaceae bacterium]|nr:hypothetical protein [Kofleriaceae bacterium]